MHRGRIMNLLKMSIVPSNIHSLLTKCILVGLFFSLMKEASFMDAASRRKAMSRKGLFSPSVNEIFNDGNQSCDPCEDFYEYTCGQWTMNNKLPPNVTRWSNIYIVKEKTQIQLKKILIKESTFSDHLLIKKTKQLYNTCLDDDILKKKGLLPLLHVIQRVGHWPIVENLNSIVDQISWLRAHYNYASMTGEGALFNINILPDAYDHTIRRIYIVQPTSIFGQYRSIPNQKMATYKDSLKSMVGALVSINNTHISPNKIQKLIDDVIRFRQAIVKFMIFGERSRSETNLYHPMSIAGLQNWTTQIASKSKVADINWLTVLTKTFKHARSVHFDQCQMIIVREKLYLWKLILLLRDTSADIIANHVHLHFVETHVRYTTPEMRELVVNLHRSLTGTKSENRRWYNCIQENEMKHVLASMYVKEHFPDSKKKEMTDILNNVKYSVGEMLQKSFLQKRMKESVIKKLQKMRAIIGYRSWHMNYTLLHTYYRDQTVSDVYLDNQLSSKQRQYRAELELFRYNVPKQINDGYAFLPHASYTQTTNTIGIWYDENGIWSSRWGASDLAIYNNRTVCIVKKYAESIAKEQPPENAEVIATRTVGEAFSNILGMEAAFQAYRAKRRQQQEQSSTSIIDQLYEDQAFFRAYGNMYCGFVTSEYVTGVHSRFKLRVNDPVSNLHEFSDVFNCRRGQPMRVKKKCAFWEM